MKLEIGCGERPTSGYVTNDLYWESDYPGPAWKIFLPDDSLDEVLALGVIEHMTQEDAISTFDNVHRMLKVGGEFVFDVPNLPVWCEYLLDNLDGLGRPEISRKHILSTLYGWQRFPGDEHKWGWTEDELVVELHLAGFEYQIATEGKIMIERGHQRNRFDRDWDAHFYVVAVKP